ncbi:TetR/AcrR family transcriptional regulator [Paenalcaligenes sp. Me131]|uniref:TetR/AcrR family transcriptional regulator n=1 Tax=Paenalcaligenes sp. Me131 TaxID=3392636 RepID=UPI003D2C3B71
MSKPRSIDRDKVLDLAEAIVDEHGAAALTIDAVAKAMGISKGGVQSCFGTKQGLVNAMLERWGRRYDACLEKAAGVSIEQLSSIDKISQHIHITADEQALIARAASHLSVLLEAKELREWIKRWHHERLAELDTSTPEGKKARIAYFATEGAFVLRYFGLAELSDQAWQDTFNDIAGLMGKQAM